MRRRRSTRATGPAPKCRHADYQRFKAAESCGVRPVYGADGLDAVMRADRLARRDTRQRQCTFWEPMAMLPDGVFMQMERGAWLLWNGQVLEWSVGGWCEHWVQKSHSTQRSLDSSICERLQCLL